MALDSMVNAHNNPNANNKLDLILLFLKKGIVFSEEDKPSAGYPLRFLLQIWAELHRANQPLNT